MSFIPNYSLHVWTFPYNAQTLAGSAWCAPCDDSSSDSGEESSSSSEVSSSSSSTSILILMNRTERRDGSERRVRSALFVSSASSSINVVIWWSKRKHQFYIMLYWYLVAYIYVGILVLVFSVFVFNLGIFVPMHQSVMYSNAISINFYQNLKVHTSTACSISLGRPTYKERCTLDDNV